MNQDLNVRCPECFQAMLEKTNETKAKCNNCNTDFLIKSKTSVSYI